ncbi:hypothetical protein GTR05_004616 [Salmonella enterica]|nr:hypothetical protein [Salmonella enterica]
MSAPHYRNEAEMAFSDLSMDFLEGLHKQMKLTPGDVPRLEYALFWYSAKNKIESQPVLEYIASRVPVVCGILREPVSDGHLPIFLTLMCIADGEHDMAFHMFAPYLRQLVISYRKRHPHQPEPH